MRWLIQNWASDTKLTLCAISIDSTKTIHQNPWKNHVKPLFWSGLLLIVFPFPLIWSLPTFDLGKWLALVPKNRPDHVAFGLLPPDLTNLLQNESWKWWSKASSGQLICDNYPHEFLSFTYSNLLFCQVVHHHYHLGKRGQTVMIHNDSPTWIKMN